MIIAIDGPAGSGKSTTARALARALGGYYLDTGAMYRAMALAFDRSSTPFSATGAASIMDQIRIDVALERGDLRILLSGEDVTEDIRSSEVTRSASLVSRLAAVRASLVREQRRIARGFDENGYVVVVEGRDIGTVVLPDADVKFFMVADLRARAERRVKDLEAKGEAADVEKVLADIRDRDRQDEERDHSPLRQADDALVIDTTALTPAEQLDEMLAIIKQRGLECRQARQDTTE